MAMFEVLVQPGECVINQGDVGDNFYVSERGVFTVLKDGKAVGQITTPGAAFGELALMTNAPRAASLKVSGTEAAHVWALDRNTFRKTVAKQNKSRDEEIKVALRKCTLFEPLSEHQLSTLAKSVIVSPFPAKTRIIEKGTEGHEMFILRTGQVICDVSDVGEDDIQRISQASHTDASVEADLPPSPPAAGTGGGGAAADGAGGGGGSVSFVEGSETSTSRKASDASLASGRTRGSSGSMLKRSDSLDSSLEQKCVILNEGQWFGERALVFEDSRAANVYAVDDCTCYVIARQMFDLLLGSHAEVMEKMKVRRVAWRGVAWRGVVCVPADTR